MSQASLHEAVLQLWGAVLCGAMLLFDWVEDRDERDHRFFRRLLLLSAGVLLVDAVNRLGLWADRAYVARAELLYMFLSGYRILSVYQRWLVRRLSGMGVRPSSWQIVRVYTWLLRLGEGLVILSLFTGWVYSIDAAGQYAHGPLWWGHEGILIALQLGNLLLVWFNRDYFGRRRTTTLTVSLLLPAIAMVAQGWYYRISLIALAVSLSLFILFLQLQADKRMELAERQKRLDDMGIQLMLSQLRPHFLFNVLSGIKALCITDQKASIRAVDDFSQYLRQNLDNLSRPGFLRIGDEVSYVRHYIALEQLRFGERIRYEEDLQDLDFSLPVLVVQPLVENAIKHGLLPKPEGGCIRLSTRLEGSTHCIRLEDDGVGFCPGEIAEPDTPHVGVRNIEERLRQLCGGSLRIESRPGGGTAVLIAIPNRPNDNLQQGGTHANCSH